MAFGAMPFGWITSGVLRGFSGRIGVLGRSIAALKCYLAIAAYRDYRTQETVLSLFDLATITGMSKPTVREGIALLEAEGLLYVQPKAERNTNVYLLQSIDLGYRKVPQDIVGFRLRDMSPRGVATLDALKLYVAMLYHRDEEDNCAKVTHRTLIDYTGVRPDGVAAGNSVLHSHGFVIVRSEDSSFSGRPMNSYRLRGDFAGSMRRLERPTEMRSRQRRVDRLLDRREDESDCPF